MKKRNAMIVIILIALAIAVYLNRSRIHFDWGAFWLQLRYVRIGHLLAGVALIYATYWLRSIRWAVFLSPTKKVSAGSLVGSQFIGFTAVALFGRLADLTRPYLLARRVGLALSSQIAVYTIERMFDLGAAAIIFSSAMAVTPKSLPHHELFIRVGVGSLALTIAIAIFAVVVRVAGERVARFARHTLGRFSKSAGESVATKILGFRDGLNTLASFKEFLIVLAISLTMWAMIGGSYVETAHSFVHTPQLATLSFSRTMLMMAASIGGGLLTLPVIGWFTQIAAMAAAMQAFYGTPLETATACGALLLIVTTLSIVPAGLIFARVEHVSLKRAANESSEDESVNVDIAPVSD